MRNDRINKRGLDAVDYAVRQCLILEAGITISAALRLQIKVREAVERELSACGLRFMESPTRKTRPHV